MNKRFVVYDWTTMESKGTYTDFHKAWELLEKLEIEYGTNLSNGKHRFHVSPEQDYTLIKKDRKIQ